MMEKGEWHGNVSAILGKTITKIDGAKAGAERVEIALSDGTSWVLYHEQDCCEWVAVVDVIGDVADLIGNPLTMAEEVESDETPEGYKHDYEPESQTWTFYKFATVKGYVTIRWLGQSNGYYGESVTFKKL